jgi:hypothetical protein
VKVVGANVTSISVGGRVYMPGPDGSFEMLVDDALEAIGGGHGLEPAAPVVEVVEVEEPEEAPAPPTPQQSVRRGRR